MHIASPDTIFPVKLPDGTVHKGTVFLKPAINHPRFEVGDYTYASALEPPEDWAVYLAPYLYEFSPEKLVIGKFCQIAHGVRFITASANHRYDGFSSFPFAIFDDVGVADRPSLPKGGPDTIVGNDVWIGMGAKILPGAKIGNGVIVGAGSVVSGAIPDYSIVSGNPARIIRNRFDEYTISRLNKIAWWEWEISKIAKSEAAICGNDIDALDQVSAN